MALAEQGLSLQMEDPLCSRDNMVAQVQNDESEQSLCFYGDGSDRKHSTPAGKPYGSGHVVINPDIDEEKRSLIRQIIEAHESLFGKDLGRCRKPEKDWMEVNIKPGEQLKSPGVYKASSRDKAEIDKTFDTLRGQGLLEAGKGPIGWPVFVVWRGGKGRVVVDLRGLNAATVADAYPLPPQEEIMAMLKDCEYITCIDVRQSFYQHMVKIGDRWKLTVVSHRGQEQFAAAPMGFCNSAAHCQRYMDKILPFSFAKCYIDDIVVFSHTFEDHLKHLEEVLSALEQANITLAPEKCFFAFQSVELLGHVVDRLGLYTNPQKVKAIKSIEFPKNLQQLENWIGITGYYRHFCEGYAKLVNPLQELKTKLLKKAPAGKRARDLYVRQTIITAPTESELASFEAVKNAICSETLLIHHDCTVPDLYRVDASYDDGLLWLC